MRRDSRSAVHGHPAAAGRDYAAEELYQHGPLERAMREIPNVCARCGRPEVSALGAITLTTPEAAAELSPASQPPLAPGKVRFGFYKLCIKCFEKPDTPQVIEAAFRRRRQETH